MSTKIIKRNYDIFGDFIYRNFNDAIDNDIFINILKNANVSPVFEKVERTVTRITDLSVLYQTCFKYLKDVSTEKCRNIVMIYYSSTSLVSEKFLTYKIVWHPWQRNGLKL